MFRLFLSFLCFLVFCSPSLAQESRDGAQEVARKILDYMEQLDEISEGGKAPPFPIRDDELDKYARNLRKIHSDEFNGKLSFEQSLFLMGFSLAHGFHAKSDAPSYDINRVCKARTERMFGERGGYKWFLDCIEQEEEALRRLQQRRSN